MKPTTGGVLFGSSVGGFGAWYLSKSGIIPNVPIAEQSLNPRSLKIPSSRLVMTGMAIGALIFRSYALAKHGPDPNPYDD